MALATLMYCDHVIQWSLTAGLTYQCVRAKALKNGRVTTTNNYRMYRNAARYENLKLSLSI